MKCETCGKDTETVRCAKCESEVAKLGPFCYLCGAMLSQGTGRDVEAEGVDFEDRVLCSDGTCIGVINEQGICKVCGKPYVAET